MSPRRASFVVAFFSLGICSKRYAISGIPSLLHGNYIVACFSAGISSKKSHISRIPSFLQAREFHRCLLPGRLFLQEESQLRNSELCASTGAPSPLVFRPTFPPGGITSPQFRNSKLSASTGAPSPLSFRPAFPPGSITSPEFKTYCKHGNSVPASDFVRGNLNIYANEVWYIPSTISNCFPYETWGFFLRSILQCCQR